MNPTMTLADVATVAADGGRYELAFRSFLDRFREQPDALALATEPARLAGRIADGAVIDAYLAATADALAAEFSLAVPAWAASPDRTLRRPWFALPWAGLRTVLLLESPAPFRSRNLFVSANALCRA
jgi:hypothetical protein